jgi:SAM-dependent methyltransferase
MVDHPIPRVEGDDTMKAVELLRSQRQVEATSISAAQSTFDAVLAAAELQYPVKDFRSLVARHDACVQVGMKLLIRRDFWEYDDYADVNTFVSVGPQFTLFDNYKWTTELAQQFRGYAELWFPTNEHTHLEFVTYTRLLRHFRLTLIGAACPTVLPRWVKLKPRYGVAIPRRQAMAPFELYTHWLSHFHKALGIRRALVCRAGSGVAAFATRFYVPFVSATDPSPEAVLSMDADRKRQVHRFTRMKMEVAATIPEDGAEYDLITYAVGAPMLDVDSGSRDYAFAPSFTGIRGDLEAFFEDAANRLKPGGVLVIPFSNVHQLAEPDQPHPIEHELRANRRFVLLDFYQQPMKGNIIDNEFVTTKIRFRARAELWVLHRLEDLPAFGWIHGVPGAQVPSHILSTGNNSVTFTRKRLKLMRSRVEEQGGDWADYKGRLMQILSDNSGDEDEVAMMVRAKLDPTYAEEVAEKCKQHILRKLEHRDEEVRRIGQQPSSPRDRYDAAYRAQSSQTVPAAASTAAADPASAKSGKKTKKQLRRQQQKQRQVDVSE